MLALILILLGIAAYGADVAEDHAAIGGGGVGITEAGPPGEPCGRAAKPKRFGLYSAGPRIGNLNLSEILVNCQGKGNGNGKITFTRVSYIYGQCDVKPNPGEPFSEGGCAPPVEIQNWPACSLPGGRPLSGKANRRIRGVPARRSGGGLELQTGRTVVVVFGSESNERAAVAGLRREPSNRPADLPKSEAGPRTSLPAPETGAFECPVR